MLRFLWTVTLAAGIAGLAVVELPPEKIFSLLENLAPERSELVGLVRPMPICGGGRRISCVVDGDTFWVAGEKVRLQGIDAPEVNGACAYERELAQEATRRLSEILSDDSFSLERSGKDRYGRTLARVDTQKGEAGDIFVREGLARPWKGRRENWCA